MPPFKESAIYKLILSCVRELDNLYAEKCKIRGIQEDMDHTLQGIGDL